MDNLLFEQIDKVLSKFEKVSLEEINEVKLQNRFDSKYIFHTRELFCILEEICNSYFVLKTDGTRVQHYSSAYFDTPEDLFYLTHHNGKSGRFKIRKREYINSEISFTEVKYKTNKGKTSKKRVASSPDFTDLSANDKFFLRQNTLADPEILTVKLKNNFNRITLVSRNFNERCTIDFNLSFEKYGQILHIPDIVITELKQDSRNMKSKLAEILKSQKIYTTGFSKYCIGRALTDIGIKKNRFKPKILKIKREYTPITIPNPLNTVAAIA